MRFLRSLPPTPAVYRNDKALADLMLGEHAFGYVGGAGSCAGCGEGDVDPDDGRGDAAGPRPGLDGDRRRDRLQHGLRQHLPVQPVPRALDELAVRERARPSRPGSASRWDQAGHADRRLWVIGGDGAMYDIGFQALSRMVASGADIKVLVLDTQVYSNTGGQASTASFGGQVTKLSAFGAAIHGRPEPRKELGRILMAHGDVYVAQTTPAHLNHFYRSIIEANEYPGPGGGDRLRGVHARARHRRRRRQPARRGSRSTRARSRCSPTTRGAATGSAIGCRCRAIRPCATTGRGRRPGEPVDFLAFARTEGRFVAHFGPYGEPTPEILATHADRLANWHTLQELAGIATSESRPTSTTG